MESQPVLDKSLLLKPISETLPSGEDIRLNNPDLYYKIKDARTSARTLERQNPEDKAKINSFWDTVYDNSIAVLTSQCKDLEISAWFIEALVRKHNLAGFRDGFSLINGLLVTFWDSIYPLPESNNMADRLFAFSGLNGIERPGALIVPLYAIQITQGQTKGPYALWNYVQAIELEQIIDPKKKEEKIANGSITLDELNTASQETSKDFFLAFKDDIQDSLNEFETYTAFVDNKCGLGVVPTSNIKTVLEMFQEAFNFLTKDLFLPSKQIDEIDSQTQIVQQAFPVVSPIQVSSRDAAFKNLLEIARFFKDSEPQSPLPYILERAVKWGQLSLPQLLTELIDDEGVRSKLFQLTGIDNNN